MPTKVSDEDFLESVKFLSESKVPFTFSINNHTYKIDSQIGDYITTDNKIKMKELHFVKLVKDYVYKNEIHLKIKNDFKKNKDGTYNHDTVKYFDYKIPNKSFTHKQNLFEVDINAAYWETAFKIGIISEEIYKKGFTVAKNTRLAALGSLAKRTIIWEFDGTTFEYKDTVSKPTEHLWFKICEYLTNTMYKAARRCGKDFIFYWVDGIYVKGLDAVVKCCEAFEEDGYKYKIRKINWIKFDLKNKKLIVDDNINPKPRPFPLTEPKFKIIFQKKLESAMRKEKRRLQLAA